MTLDRGVGEAFDAWFPRVLKVTALIGFALSIAQAALGEFNPVLFGGSLTAASGGFLGDALNAIKPPKE